jgi:large subunit ribosomal protein L1
MARGKRVNSNEDIRPTEPMELDAAVLKLRDFKAPKFDQTVNAVVHLGIDPKQADQALRGSISMPNGIGKSARVIAFCPPDRVEEASEAGAIEAGGEELVKKIQEGWFDSARSWDPRA